MNTNKLQRIKTYLNLKLTYGSVDPLRGADDRVPARCRLDDEVHGGGLGLQCHSRANLIRRIKAGFLSSTHPVKGWLPYL